MEKAIIFLEKRELPPHWDRDILFSHGEQESTNNSTTASSESDPDDDDEEDDEEGKYFSDFFPFFFSLNFTKFYIFYYFRGSFGKRSFSG